MTIKSAVLSILKCNTGNYGLVRSLLRKAVKDADRDVPLLLDVGGRKSPYTRGLNAVITVTDLPQEVGIRKDLGLGLTESSAKRLKAENSNVFDVVFDDMADTRLPPSTFDIVACVEVLEHVIEDSKFAENLSKVLRDGGQLVLTTPNGDYLTKINNPDHVRHYRRSQLQALLGKYFRDVSISANVEDDGWFKSSIRPMNGRNAWRAPWIIVAGFVVRFRSLRRYPSDDRKAIYLHAVCRK